MRKEGSGNRYVAHPTPGGPQAGHGAAVHQDTGARRQRVVLAAPGASAGHPKAASAPRVQNRASQNLGEPRSCTYRGHLAGSTWVGSTGGHLPPIGCLWTREIGSADGILVRWLLYVCGLNQNAATKRPAVQVFFVTVQSSGPWAGIPCWCSESCRHGARRGGGDL